MNPVAALLMRMFGRPSGILGRFGGMIMARTNADFGVWVCDLLEIEPADRVLEVGFGPGVIIRCASERAHEGWVAGIDLSREMVEQARIRNAPAIREGRVDLRYGSVASLPFHDGGFDKALAINSMQVWPDASAGLLEMRRVMKPGGRIALGFTRHSGQESAGLEDALGAVNFADTRLVRIGDGFCLLATKPRARPKS
jgi:ubiquinone/menaquinone biosynthesis C-methylase UbiE